MVEVKMHAAAVIRIAGQAQQGVHALLLVLGIEKVAGAFALGAAGAADAVGVMLVLFGHIIVDDGVHIRNIDAAGGHIGGNQHIDLAGLKALHDAVAFRLAQIAMQAIYIKMQPGQLVCQHAGVVLGVAKHHYALVILADDDLGQVSQLVAAGGQQLVLGNFGAGFLHRLNVYFGGVVLVQPADIQYLAADGGAEHG